MRIIILLLIIINIIIIIIIAMRIIILLSYPIIILYPIILSHYYPIIIPILQKRKLKLTERVHGHPAGKGGTRIQTAKSVTFPSLSASFWSPSGWA